MANHLLRECRRAGFRCGFAVVERLCTHSRLRAHRPLQCRGIAARTGSHPATDASDPDQAAYVSRIHRPGLCFPFPDFVTDMKAWLSEGRIKYRQDITDGLENAPRELIGLLKGENFGKKLIRVSPDPAQR